LSSFIVRPETINRIVTYLDTMTAGGSIWASTYKRLLEKYHLDNIEKGARILILDSDEWPKDMAKKLLDLNISAMNQRYSENTGLKDVAYMKTKGVDFTYHFTPSPLIQVYKSIQCLSYQCAEGDVPQTELYKFLDELENTIAHEIVSQIPEYSKAGWD